MPPRMTRAALRAQQFQITQDEGHQTNSIAATLQDTEDTQDLAHDDAILSETSGNSIIGSPVGDKMPTISRSKGQKLKKVLKGLFNNEEQNEKTVQHPINMAIDVQSSQGNTSANDSETQHSTSLDITSPTASSETEASVLQEVPPLTHSQHDVAISEAQETLHGQVEPSEHLASSLQDPKTSKFDPELYRNQTTSDRTTLESQDDSFVGSIKTRSPSKHDSFSPEPERSQSNTDGDSFVDEIQSRSPAKPVSRIEDSVEAMDALEEALELVTKELPDISDDALESPTYLKRGPPKPQPKPAAPGSGTVAQKRKIRPSPASAQQQAAPSKPPVQKKNAQQNNPPSLSFSTSPAKTTAPKPKLRPVDKSTLSTNKPGFVPAKSTKAPTKSGFSLPGEAIAAKLKAQREERQKREEEAEKQKKVFKARPAPRFSTVQTLPVRGTTTSKARQSIMINGGATKENEVPVRKSSRPSTADPSIKKRQSTLTGAPTTTKFATLRPTANSSRPRSTILPSSTSPTFLTPNLFPKRTLSTTAVSGAAPPAAAAGNSSITASDLATQRAKARQAYSRTKALKEQTEKEKREKEDAAKKARVAAAERGRQASREWAEKMKRKQQQQQQQPQQGVVANDSGDIAPGTGAATSIAT